MWRNVLALVLLVCFVLLTVFAFRENFSTNQSSQAVSPIKIPVATPQESLNVLLQVEKNSSNEIERLNLQNNLATEINASGMMDNVSLYYKNLNSGYEVAINADRAWVPASTVKAFVVVEAFRQKKLRLVDFDSRVTIRKENIVPTELEAAEYQPLREGVKATIRELVYAMIVQSDNTAYNTLLDVLDRRNIMLTLRHLGLTDTVVGEKLSLSDEQYAFDLTVPGRQPNRTTARDFGRLFDLMYENKVDDADEMIAIFKKQKIKDMLPAFLPTDVVIAHKTGVWASYLHDGGIVYKPNEPFILTIFTNSGDPSIGARLSKVAYYKSRDVLGAQTSSWSGIIFETINRIKTLFHRAGGLYSW